MKKRGLILSKPIESGDAPGAFSPATTIPLAVIRTCLLYWDHIDCPDDMFTRACEQLAFQVKLKEGTQRALELIVKKEQLAGLSDEQMKTLRTSFVPQVEEIFLNSNYHKDISLLREQGFLQRTEIAVPKDTLLSKTPEFLHTKQVELLADHNASNEISWSLAQAVDDLLLSPEVADRRTVIEFELYNCLPVPSEDTPLEDIFDFKFRRQDELAAFRAAMDDMYLEIVNSNDVPRSKDVTLVRLERSLLDLQRILKDGKITSVATSLKSLVNTTLDSAGVGAGLMGGAMAFNLPFQAAAAVGLSAMALRFVTREASKPRDLPPHLHDYAYLLKLSAELGD